MTVPIVVWFCLRRTETVEESLFLIKREVKINEDGGLSLHGMQNIDLEIKLIFDRTSF